MRRFQMITLAALALAAAACKDATPPQSPRIFGIRAQEVSFQVPSVTPQVGAGAMFTCALKTDGTVVCWGDNVYGEATPPVGLVSVVQLSVGTSNVCALKSDGTAVCWGSDGSGEVDVPAGLGPVSQVSTGNAHSCVLKSDATVFCWGDNAYGESTPPVGLASVRQISAGGANSCALKTDATVVCWGGIAENFQNVDAAAPSGLVSVAQVSASSDFICALKTDGTVVCWGDNYYGQSTPPAGLTAVAQISAGPGSAHVCAAKTDGTVVCWGSNIEGESSVPVGLSSVTQVSVSGRHACAVKIDGTVVCWGGWNGNYFGEATVPAGLNLIVSAPQSISFTSALPNPAYVGSTYAVTGTATSGLAVSYSTSTSGICRVSGNTVTFIAAGTCTVAADQPGDATHLAAPEQIQTITVITVDQGVQNLIALVESMGLAHGETNSLIATLKNINTGNVSSTCGKLGAFVNKVNADTHSGALTAAESVELLEAVNAILASEGCS